MLKLLQSKHALNFRKVSQTKKAWEEHNMDYVQCTLKKE